MDDSTSPSTASSGDRRLVILIDMDCFYVQVEQRERPELWGKPVGVVQYSKTAYKGGGLIAVSYEARARGVKRGSMFGEDAKAVCPEIELVCVPEVRGKASLNKYRQASAEVFTVIRSYDERVIVERASIDEAFLDVTDLVDERVRDRERTTLHVDQLPSTHVLCEGHDVEDYERRSNTQRWLDQITCSNLQMLRLSYAAEIAEHIRAAIKERTQFFCSAGVATNKTLAKLICSKHKPRQQTVLCPEYLPQLWADTKIKSVRFLGGKLGVLLMERLGIETMAELAQTPRSVVTNTCKLGKVTDWLLKLAAGIDDEPVKVRQFQRSLASSKNFYGSAALAQTRAVEEWLMSLCEDLAERYADERENNNRVASTLLVGVHSADSTANGTRQVRLPDSYVDADQLFSVAIRLAREFNKSNKDGEWFPPVSNLHTSISNFEPISNVKTKPITDFFNQSVASTSNNSSSLNLDTAANDSADTSSSNIPFNDPTSCQSVPPAKKPKSSILKFAIKQDAAVLFDESKTSVMKQKKRTPSTVKQSSSVCHYFDRDHDQTVLHKPSDSTNAEICTENQDDDEETPEIRRRASSFIDLFEDDDQTNEDIGNNDMAMVPMRNQLQPVDDGLTQRACTSKSLVNNDHPVLSSVQESIPAVDTCSPVVSSTEVVHSNGDTSSDDRVSLQQQHRRHNTTTLKCNQNSPDCITDMTNNVEHESDKDASMSVTSLKKPDEILVANSNDGASEQQHVLPEVIVLDDDDNSLPDPVSAGNNDSSPDSIDIDRATFASLPSDIQLEIRLHLMKQRRLVGSSAASSSTTMTTRCSTTKSKNSTSSTPKRRTQRTTNSSKKSAFSITDFYPKK